MEIKQKDSLILIALMENPLATDAEIVGKLKEDKVDVAISTVNRRIKKLHEDNIIKGAYTEINHSRINMGICSYILIPNSKNGWNKNLMRLEKMCDLHPYTAFRNRIYGSSNGLFVQFRLPLGIEAKSHLIELLEFLKGKEILDNYEFLDVGDPVSNFNVDLEYWIQNKQSWEADEKKSKKMDAIMLESHPFQGSSKRDPPILNLLSIADIVILTELGIDCSRSQQQIRETITKNLRNEIDYKDVLDNIPQSKQSFSRKINYLRDNNVIRADGTRLSYNRKEFGILNYVLYIGEYTKEAMGNLYYAFKQNIIPFDATLTYSETQFMLRINLPSTELFHLSDLLNNYFQNVRMYLFGAHSVGYPLYHGCFDEETHSWKIDRDSLIDSFKEKI